MQFPREMTLEETEWTRKYKERLQHVMSRMNHHIHPLVNPTTGERRPLRSCIPKGKKTGCRGNFPLDAEMCEEPTLVCPCIATKQQLPTSGPRSSIGCVLSARNSSWLNAGPSAWMVFSGDNGDIEFPHRLPIMAETHEPSLVFDCRWSSIAQQTADLQSAQSLAAGYFGGYAAKMQDIGRRELQAMGQALERKLAGENKNEAKQFHDLSRRIVKDLEAKGTVRTSVEGLNLSMHAANPDVLAAECWRTFPTIMFPAQTLLHREEVETLKKVGRSVIAAIHGHKTNAKYTYIEAPADLMYGFRGNDEGVDLMSPFEMWRFLSNRESFASFVWVPCYETHKCGT